MGSGPSTFKVDRARDIFSFKLAGLLQKALSAHLGLKVMMLVGVAGPVIWGLGCAYSAVTGAPLSVATYKIYTVLVRTPGARVTEETSLLATLLVNLAFILHIFAFAIIIGVVSEEIKSKLSAVRHGNIPLAIQSHTLVLHWNRQAPLLLRQMAANGHGETRTLGGDIVVLADRPKGELDAEVERALHGSGMSFVTRRGVPYSAKDLDTVAAAHAKTVLLLHPDHDEAAEVHKTATLLALQSCRSHPSTTLLRQRVIVQNPDTPAPGRVSEADAAHHSVARVVRRSLPPSANMKLIEVNGSRNMARLIAQSAVQPGVSTILGQICQSAPGAPDFHLVPLEACGLPEGREGVTYQEARRKLANSVVLGVLSHRDRTTAMNPPDTARLLRGDRLIVLSHGAVPELAPGGSTAAGLDLAALQQRLQAAQPPASSAKAIVVVGWSGPTNDLLTGLTEFAAAGSEVIFVGPQRPPDFPAEAQDSEGGEEGQGGGGGDARYEVQGRTCRFIQGDLLERRAYERAGVASANAVILGSLQAEDAKDADARMLSSLLMVQDLVDATCRAGRTPHIVACVQYPETVFTANHILTQLGKTRLSSELLQPGELVSGMLLQVAHEPALGPALSELIDSAVGAELYLRRPERYGLNDSTVTFAEVNEAARLRGETAIGYVDGPDGSLVLAPHAGALCSLTNNSRVVVLSEH